MTLLDCFDLTRAKERSKSVTDPLIIPHPSRLSSAELPVLGGPKRSLIIDGANPYHFQSIQCFGPEVFLWLLSTHFETDSKNVGSFSLMIRSKINMFAVVFSRHFLLNNRPNYFFVINFLY
jgi:hypothetical protein